MFSIKTQPKEDSLAAFIAAIEPLDVLLFQGSDVVSDTIRDFERFAIGVGCASHVGVVITKEWCDKIRADSPIQLLVWESILSGPLNDGVPDEESGGTTFGVQVRDLEALLKTGAKVGLCKLKDNPIRRRADEPENAFEARTAKLKRKLARVYDRYQGASYNWNPLDLLACIFPKLRPLRDLNDATVGKLTGMNTWLFCSEFTALLYQYIGVLPGDLDFRDAAPSDYLPDKDPATNAREAASPIHAALSGIVGPVQWLSISPPPAPVRA